MALRNVELQSLELEAEHWKNPRMFTGLTEEEIAGFGEDIKTRGIITPLLVQRIKRPDGSGWIELVIDGQRRYKGAHAAGFKPTAPIPVVDLDEEIVELTPKKSAQILLDMLATGKLREGLSSYEETESALRLREAGKSCSEIGRAIGRDASWVSRMLKARELASDAVLEAWRTGEIPDEMLRDFATLRRDKQDAKLAEALELRGSGDPAEARARVKEAVAEEADAQKEREAKSEARASRKAPKASSDASEPKAKEGRDKPHRIERHALEDIVTCAKQKKPQHEYVKGVVDAVKMVLGHMDISDLAKAWHTYIARLSGDRPTKPAKPRKAAKRTAKRRR